MMIYILYKYVLLSEATEREERESIQNATHNIMMHILFIKKYELL